MNTDKGMMKKKPLGLQGSFLYQLFIGVHRCSSVVASAFPAAENA